MYSGKEADVTLKEKITKMIRDYILEYEKKDGISTRWRTPLVGFADVRHPDILKLKETIAESHKLPSEVLASAKIVISYFVPFTEALADTNRKEGEEASPEWAQAYEETNTMFCLMNDSVVERLKRMGYEAAVSPEAFTFDQKKLISNWSQRHYAKAAGLGTFGINNMLITKIGCCGRYGSIVTSLDVEPDKQMEEEYCILKKTGRCGVCISRCPSGALTLEGFDRDRCYRVLRYNAKRYTGFGSSYYDETGMQSNSIGSEVCGKCTTNVPCAFLNCSNRNG